MSVQKNWGQGNDTLAFSWNVAELAGTKEYKAQQKAFLDKQEATRHLTFVKSHSLGRRNPDYGTIVIVANDKNGQDLDILEREYQEKSNSKEIYSTFKEYLNQQVWPHEGLSGEPKNVTLLKTRYKIEKKGWKKQLIVDEFVKA